MKTFVVLCFVSVVFSAKFPEYLKKCSKDTNNLDCVVFNIKAVVDKLRLDGEPKFKLPNISPFKVAEIELQATPQLTTKIKNGEVRGAATFDIKNASFSTEKLYMSTHVYSKVEFLGDYTIDGRILVLPISGQGRCNITMVDYDVEYTAKFHTIERKGKQYLQVKDEDSELKLSNVKRVYSRFDNLFNGDKRLGDEMHRFIDENWLEIFNEVKPAVEQTTAYAIMNYFINGYLRHIPIDEMFEK